MNIYNVTVAISVMVFIAIGSYSGRKVQSIDDYFVAGRRAPTLLILGTLVASVFSTSIFLGEAGFTYDGQLGPYLLLPGIAVTGYVYGALFFGTFIRRSRAPTVADYFGQRFASHRVQQAAGVTIIFGLGGYLLVVTQGAAILISDLTDLSYPAAIVCAWLSYSVFTLYAGSRGVIITDTLMFLLFTGATIVFVAFLLDGFGGVSASIEALSKQTVKPDLTAWHGMIGEGTEWPTAMDFLIWLVIVDLSWSLVYAVSPWQSSRHLMAKNEHVVLRSAIYACLVVIFMQILIYGAGGLINLAKYDIDPSETVMLWAARNLVPEFLGAVLIAGIVAAALSSASTFLSLVGFSVSNDLTSHPGGLKLRTTRLLMSAVALVVLCLSIFVPANVFWIMLFIGTVFASSWGAVGLMSIWSTRITADGAFWGLIVGLLGNVIPAGLDYLDVINLPSYLNPALLGSVASVLTILFFARRQTPTPEEVAYLAQLHKTPKEDLDPGKTRVTLIAPALLMVYGAVMPFLLLNYYVLPFQRGRATVLVDDSINWSQIEAWIAFGPALLFIPLGLIAAITIKRRYGRSEPIDA
ncbi:MAG: sodium:solute symporter family protein [Congregibacter sp.]|nr:sodium:solute symporter family protein [Congregibacter sp.]